MSRVIEWLIMNAVGCALSFGFAALLAWATRLDFIGAVAVMALMGVVDLRIETRE